MGGEALWRGWGGDTTKRRSDRHREARCRRGAGGQRTVSMSHFGEKPAIDFSICAVIIWT